MSTLNMLLVAIFLPLFPFSMLFNRVFARAENTGLRILLLVGWPAFGIALLSTAGEPPPGWVVHWSLLTALLYGFRALALRDLALWLSHVATSAWALMWILVAFGDTAASLLIVLVAFSGPLALLAWLTGYLQKTVGAAYAGAPGGLATSLPRLSGLLVLLVLAAIGTPLFPGFFVLLGILNALLPASPVTAFGILVVWMLWAWAGMRILQGLIVGEPDDRARGDIGLAHTGLLGIAVAVFTISGVWLSGSLV